MVSALWTCKGKEPNPLRRLKVSNELLDFFYEKPVHMLVTDTSHIWEEAEGVNRAALEQLFGRGSAQVAAGGSSSLVPPKGPPPRRWKSDRPLEHHWLQVPCCRRSGCLPDRPRLQAPRRRSSGLPPDHLKFLQPHCLAGARSPPAPQLPQGGSSLRRRMSGRPPD